MVSTDAAPQNRLEVEVEPDQVGLSADRLACLDQLLQRYVDDGRLPGWSLLVSRRGRIAHLSAYGRRDLEADRPVEFDTLFRIYSMTKPIVSVAAMMLYERGAFELTDPIARYLPAFAEPRVYVAGPDLNAVTVPAIEPIRVWHLLTHTAGLTYGFHRANAVDGMYRAAGFEWSSPPGLDLAGVVERWAGLPLLFQPGTEWNYSVATDVLGRLIEVVSGRPLEAFLAEEIFGPLGMTDTVFEVDEARRDRLAALYVPGAGGRATRNDAMDATASPSTWTSGGSGLVSTLSDYHRFTQFLLHRGRHHGVRLLGDRTVRYMTRNHLPGGADLATFGRPLFPDAPFAGVGFGLGFSVVLDPVGMHVGASVGEYGWGGAASTAFWVDPAEELTTIFMTQLLPSGVYPIRSQLRALINAALVD